MARMLLDENLPVKQTDEEEGNIPNILISKNYGIEVQDNPVTYSCVERKVSRHLSDDGTYIISGYKWIPFPSYCATLDQALKSILRRATALKLKETKKIELQVAVDKIVDANKEITERINAALSDRVLEQLSTVEKKYKELELKLKGLDELENKLVSDADSLIATIKEKRKIIVER